MKKFKNVKLARELWHKIRQKKMLLDMLQEKIVTFYRNKFLYKIIFMLSVSGSLNNSKTVKITLAQDKTLCT